MSVPRTIVITTLPSVGGNGALTSRSVSPTCNMSLTSTHIERNSSLSSDGENKLDEGNLVAPVRKRQRLDHLSLEEKIMRRKLKNRVAAQSARDRKKARMGELEEQVACLEKENRALQKKNSNLRQRNAELEKENAELKLQLWLQSKEAVGTTHASIKEESSSESIGQAWFINDPLQKEQDLQLPILLMMQFVCLQVILSVMAFLTCYTSAVKSSVTSILHPLQVKKCKKNLRKGTFQERNRPLKWWGPHQQAWNPSKN